MTPTARTLETLRKEGVCADKAEQWLPVFNRPGSPPRRPVTRDLFGFVDVVACRPGAICAIQVTSKSNVASRRAKILDDCTFAAMSWLRSGGTIEIWGWYQPQRGARWKYDITTLTLDNFPKMKKREA